jgi:hypothetical protein
MRLNLPASPELARVLLDLSKKLDALSGGHIEGTASKGTAAPTTGLWAQGDFYKNTTPTEQGTAGSKYVVLGWICTVSGEPGTWLQARVLTGN